jgi:hypothetical protein
MIPINFLTKVALEIRLPSFREKSVIKKLQSKYSTKYDEFLHQSLLEEIFRLAKPASTSGFQLFNTEWKDLGFSTEEPILDLAQGELALDSILYILRTHTFFMQNLFRLRCRRSDADQSSYPVMYQYLNILRELCIRFEVIYDNGELNYTRHATLKPSWQLLLEKNGFFRLCFVALLMLDRSWEQESNEYTEKNFDDILRGTMDKFDALLLTKCTMSDIEEEIFSVYGIEMNL